MGLSVGGNTSVAEAGFWPVNFDALGCTQIDIVISLVWGRNINFLGVMTVSTNGYSPDPRT